MSGQPSWTWCAFLCVQLTIIYAWPNARAVIQTIAFQCPFYLPLVSCRLPLSFLSLSFLLFLPFMLSPFHLLSLPPLLHPSFLLPFNRVATYLHCSFPSFLPSIFSPSLHCSIPPSLSSAFVFALSSSSFCEIYTLTCLPALALAHNLSPLCPLPIGILADWYQVLQDVPIK